MTPQKILKFWFEDTEEAQWWAKDRKFDRSIREHFADVHKQAARCELYQWRRTPEGRLAEIIVLDQFSRNMYRNDPRAFENDMLALALSQEAVAAGDDRKLTPIQRSFIYMPYMHSESPLIHELAVAFFTESKLESNLKFALKHQAIIMRFGRYPHRNAVLGRQSTPAEVEFLKHPGSGF